LALTISGEPKKLWDWQSHAPRVQRRPLAFCSLTRSGASIGVVADAMAYLLLGSIPLLFLCRPTALSA
jgi:hypothetical protein